MSVSARRRRYLTAMGIDVWVGRRNVAGEPPPVAEQAVSAGVPALTPAIDREPGQAPDRAPAAPVAPVDARFDASVDAQVNAHRVESTDSADAPAIDPARARAMLEQALEEPEPAPVDTGQVATAASGAPAPEEPEVRERAAGVESGAEAQVVVAPDVPADLVPQFRLRALTAGVGLLLVDDAQVRDLGRDALQRLADLMRAACMLREDGAAGTTETQEFFWPQLDAADVDQSMPRAVEALTAYVRRRTNDGEGFLVIVDPLSGGDDASVRVPLSALEQLPVRRARVDAAFLDAPSPEVHQRAWRALAVLRDVAT